MPGQNAFVPITTVIASTGGAAAFFISLLILVVILLSKIKRQRKEIEMTKKEIDEFMLGMAAEKANAKGINGLFVLPYDKSLEVSKSSVKFRKSHVSQLLRFKNYNTVWEYQGIALLYIVCHRFDDTWLRSIWSSR